MNFCICTYFPIALLIFMAFSFSLCNLFPRVFLANHLKYFTDASAE